MIFAVVEDSRSQAEVLKALLRSEGHQVEVFADGASCLEALKSRSFDFFVIDWNLPDMGGRRGAQAGSRTVRMGGAGGVLYRSHRRGGCLGHLAHGGR